MVTSQPDVSKLRQKIAERRRQESTVEEPQAVSFDDDLVPEQVYERTPEETELDAALERIDIIDAYNRWCGKMVPKTQGDRREGIKISCPIPGHIDSNPSAWINLDKQTWFCGACQQGGDKYDIAAFRHGFPVPGYKEGVEFHKLREKMASDFGYTINKTASGNVTVTAPEPEPDLPVEDAPAPPSVHLASVTPIANKEEEDENAEPIIFEPFDWRKVCPSQTFLDTYMRTTTADDAPEEYHFFHALMAIGFALGRDVKLMDLKPVHGNLFICTLGRTGLGKSKAKSHLDDLLRRAMPYDSTMLPSKGVKILGGTGSAENLIYQFQEPVPDPVNPKAIAYYAPVRGLIDFNELGGLMAVSNRPGSAMKFTMMEFYDGAPLITSSSMGTGTKRAEEPFAQALTTSQPRALRDLLNKRDDASGFLNRWIFVPGTPKTKSAIGGAMVHMGDAAKQLQDIQGWAATFRSGEFMQWGGDAAAKFTEFFHGVIEPAKKHSTNDLLVRIDLTMKKLILLFAANRFEKVVSLQSVEDAIHCYKFLVTAYGITWGEIGNDEYSEASTYILDFIKRCAADKYKQGQPQQNPSVREIKNSCQARGYSHDLIIKILKNLVALDEIEEFKTQGRGRPTIRYRHVS